MTESNNVIHRDAPSVLREIDILIRARYPVLYLLTYEEARIEKLLTEMPVPYAKFDVAKVQAMVDGIIVSHKVDHGRNGQLHEETAYGIVDPKTHDGFNLVRRKPLISLSDKEIDRVLDPSIRQRLRDADYARAADRGSRGQ